SRVLWLRSGDVHRGPDSYEREKFRRCFAVQSNATVCAGSRMHKALVKAVGRSEFAPITHRVSDIPASSSASRRNYAIALHAKAVRSRTFVLLFGVDLEISFRRLFRGSPNRTRHGHQATVALPDINALFSQRKQHSHGGWFVRTIWGYVIRASCCAPCVSTA